jgi:hypothetical protein
MDSLTPETAPPELPPGVVDWIARDGGDHAVLLITVDGYLRPHVMMLARDEIAVMTGSRLRVAVGEASQTAVNLRLRASATLAIYDASLACIVKTRVESGPRPLLQGAEVAELVVEDVRLDTPTAAEASARLVSGLRFEGREAKPEVRDLLRKAEG